MIILSGGLPQNRAGEATTKNHNNCNPSGSLLQLGAALIPLCWLICKLLIKLIAWTFNLFIQGFTKTKKKLPGGSF
jgi:hypothetical protein